MVDLVSYDPGTRITSGGRTRTDTQNDEVWQVLKEILQELRKVRRALEVISGEEIEEISDVDS